MCDARNDVCAHAITCFETLRGVAFLFKSRVQLDRALALRQELARQAAESALALDRVRDKADGQRDEHEAHRREVDRAADRFGKDLRPVRDDGDGERDDDEGDKRRHPKMLALTLDVRERRRQPGHLQLRRSFVRDHSSITTPCPCATSPMTVATSPASARALAAASAEPDGRNIAIPRPRLKTFRMSISDIPPVLARYVKIAGRCQEAKRTTAPRPGGRALARFPSIPPPVTCAAACTSVA